jgi:hypothetical protein
MCSWKILSVRTVCGAVKYNVVLMLSLTFYILPPSQAAFLIVLVAVSCRGTK